MSPGKLLWSSAATLALLAVAAVALGRSAPEAFVAPAASAAPDSPPPEPVAVTFQSGPYTLRGYVMKPAGNGPFPTMVYNHGSERDPSLQHQGDLGRFFQSAGYVAFFPYRRGASGSEGPYWEDELELHPGADQRVRAVELLDAENADVVAALTWISRQPYVDTRHIAVGGCSFGGIQTVLTAEKATAATAAIDFAGASMSWEGSEPLQKRMKAAARAATIPVFFVQAENDFNTEPSLVLSSEMSAASKPNAVQIFPPHGATHMAGHAHFCNHGMNEWGPNVLAFLREPPVK